MNPSIQSNRKFSMALKGVLVVAVCAIALSLSGCGSTKVYTADKTIVYGGSMYNVSNVKVFSYESDALISDTNTISLKNADKSRINSLLKEYGPFTVRQTIDLDDQHVVYQQAKIDSWSDYSKMSKQFNSAASKVQKFLADKKKTQLKL